VLKNPRRIIREALSNESWPRSIAFRFASIFENDGTFVKNPSKAMSRPVQAIEPNIWRAWKRVLWKKVRQKTLEG
jgi:hypothetical protein